jgi:glycosyltransferase involved in cell wall biosynthesis
MKILQVLVLAGTRTGGPVAFAGEGAVELERAGESVPIFTTDLALAPWGWLQRQREVRREELHPSLARAQVEIFKTRFPRRLAYSPDLIKALRREVPDVDVVHLHNLWQYPQYAGFTAAREADTPYILSPHGSFDPYLRRRGRARKAVMTRLWHREMTENASLIHVTTAAEQRLISDIAPEVPRAIVPCGLHTEEFSGELPPREEFRERHLGGYDGPLVVFLGRVTDKKGVDVLVSSMSRARELGPARLAVIGPDDSGLRPRLRKLASDLGVDGDVDFIDAVYGRERLAALAAADVWALSSHTENFGIAVVEAMAAGCPVAISPGVNLSDDVAAAEAGVIAPAEPRPFGEALGALLGDPERRHELSRAGREFAARYDWSQVAPQLLEMYRLVAGAPEGAAARSPAL